MEPTQVEIWIDSISVDPWRGGCLIPYQITCLLHERLIRGKNVGNSKFKLFTYQFLVTQIELPEKPVICQTLVACTYRI